MKKHPAQCRSDGFKRSKSTKKSKKLNRWKLDKFKFSTTLRSGKKKPINFLEREKYIIKEIN